MLLGAAIFPETTKYGGGPEKMAIVAVRQRWRRCLGEIETAGFGFLCRPQNCGECGVQLQLVQRRRDMRSVWKFNMRGS